MRLFPTTFIVALAVVGTVAADDIAFSKQLGSTERILKAAEPQFVEMASPTKPADSAKTTEMSAQASATEAPASKVK
jgi:hypothetical protein